MTTVLNVLAALVLCLPLLILATHEHRCRRRAAEAQGDPNAWIDDRIAAERHPARRAAWRSIRNDALSEENL